MEQNHLSTCHISYQVPVLFASFSRRCHSWLRNPGKAALTLSAIVQQACLFLEVTETGSLVGYYSVVKYTHEWMKVLLQSTCCRPLCTRNVWMGQDWMPMAQIVSFLIQSLNSGHPQLALGPYQLFRIPFINSGCVFNWTYNNQLESCMPAAWWQN